MKATNEILSNPLRSLADYGQSAWLDYIRRNLITSGELKRLIEEDGLRGMTSNPAIFEKAITGSSDYTEMLRASDSGGFAGMDAKAVYERLAIRDIQDAADLLKPVYQQSEMRDGYVSLEVSPYLARDTKGTIEEARRLWKTVGRDNVMIKVPATAEGIPAIAQLISEGINVNVTLLFSLAAYERVAEAYISGLEKRRTSGADIRKVASVASFFISRIDSAIDEILGRRLKAANTAAQQSLLRGLIGKVAIANAKLTYQLYQQLFSSLRWQSLAANNAQTQRVLWASTSTKNPAYRDVIYVEELIGADTVNTIPPATYDAFREHGRLRISLTEDVEGALGVMEALAEMGISMSEVTGELLDNGLLLFSEAFDKLLNAVDRSCKDALPVRINRQTYVLPTNIDAAVKVSLKEWASGGKVRRLWARDASLWTGTDEGNWLGWLGITDDQLAHAQRFRSLAKEVRNAGFSHVLLLGMGGSSLCPDVLKMTFGRMNGYPELHILDSTDPAQVEAIASKVDLKNTLFIVSSKSGSTLEPNIFTQYFFERVKQEIGAEEAGTRFIAITDPGSQMQRAAENDRFGHIFFGLPSIGGRYSALSDFGLIPAAAMGLDVPKFLDRTEEMVHACTACVPAEQNPGVVLGTILGVLAKNGRDKVTIVASPGLHDLGAWLEQLLAESTGKVGKGLIPIDRERLGAVDVYGDDRVFVYLRLESGPDQAQDLAVDALDRAGHPVVRISVADVYDLGQEFFRWEIATAVAGAIIGINPFNQPDVEASKIATKELTSEYEQTGTLPVETPLLEDEGIKLFTDGMNADVLKNTAGRDQSMAGYLKAHLNRITRHDYFGMLAYIEMNAQHEEQLQAIRHLVRDKKHAATVLGFGPRFLHSTGQAYKGGPNSGVFLQITCDDRADIPVPGQRYTFGIVKAAQARGDFQVLADRGRRALRVHLDMDVMAGFAKLREATERALSTLHQN